MSAPPKPRPEDGLGTTDLDRALRPDQVAPDAPESNPTLDKAWSEPGGEAQAYRSATQGGGDTDGHGDLTRQESRTAADGDSPASSPAGLRPGEGSAEDRGKGGS